MNKIIIANFKMNKTPAETKDYLVRLLSRFDNAGDDRLMLCLPYTSLAIGKFMLEGSKIELCAQNMSEEDEGRCTGEISGRMLKDAGVEYVIIGHSERRKKFKEDSRLINKKIKSALKNGLGVILCVGESLADRNTLKMLDVLKEQIEDALKGLYENELEKIIIAYEPVWSISSGKTPTSKEVEKAFKGIRKIIAADFSAKAGEEIAIVYGGSIDTKNARQFAGVKGGNGLLVGGASLDAATLMQIVAVV
mgnify:FL=1